MKLFVVPRPKSGDVTAPSICRINRLLLFLGGTKFVPPLQPLQPHQTNLHFKQHTLLGQPQLGIAPFYYLSTIYRSIRSINSRCSLSLSSSAFWLPQRSSQSHLVVRSQPLHSLVTINADYQIAADLVPVQGLARRAAFGNPDELMVDGIDIAGRRRSLSSQNNLEQNR